MKALGLVLVALALGASGARATAGGALPGPDKSKTKWKLVFSDEFNTLDTASWGLYEGQPGGDPGGWWEPSHVVVSGGMAHLETYRDPLVGNGLQLRETRFAIGRRADEHR